MYRICISCVIRLNEILEVKCYTGGNMFGQGNIRKHNGNLLFLRLVQFDTDVIYVGYIPVVIYYTALGELYYIIKVTICIP